MTMARTFQRSPLALAVLATLFEAPTHPYRMQQLIKERGKDKVINVERRGSLYQTVNQLLRADLIRARETEREEKRPERTIYELTDKGRQTAQTWMREMISAPTPEYPEFPAAISFLPLLTTKDALQQLQERESVLAKRIGEAEADLERMSAEIPRLFLIEDELVRALLQAELEWVRTLIEDLKTGRLSWPDAASIQTP